MYDKEKRQTKILGHNKDKNEEAVVKEIQRRDEGKILVKLNLRSKEKISELRVLLVQNNLVIFTSFWE